MIGGGRLPGPVTGVHGRSHRALLVVGALGVVFGDIGTSPLYALRECFAGTRGILVSSANVLGVLSLIFWALVMTVSMKYLLFVMRADNAGEGGILALVALVRARRDRPARGALIALGLFGAALLYGDGIITPAISVLSAVEGLSIATHAFEPLVVMVTSVSTPRETTQVDFASVQAWALALDDIYLEGALVRALEASGGVEFPAMAPDLAAAEIDTEADAITLHRTARRVAAEASAELAAAEMHEDAAAVARENASHLTRRQHDLESLANETTRATAKVAAEAHESAARHARAVAADAAQSQRATGKPRRKRSPRKTH
jgi:potassium transporter